MADGLSGLQVISIEEDLDPFLENTMDTDGYAWDVFTSGNLLLLADDTGLVIIDIVFASLPGLVDTLETPAGSCSVTAIGTNAYVACRESGLLSISFSDPGNLQLLNTFELPGPAYDVTHHENILYVASDSAGLQLVDVADPLQPNIFGWVETYGSARQVCLAKNYVLVAEHDAGLAIAMKQCEDDVAVGPPLPAHPGIAVAAYPNPFNPQLTIDFELQQPQSLQITVHDLEGNLVRELASRRFGGGLHRTTWSGRDEAGREKPSGLYLIRVQGERSTINRKVMLLR